MNKTFLFCLPILGVLVASCAHCPVCGASWGAAERERAAAEAAAAQPDMRTLSGSVSCLERVTLLPTYSLTVRLVNLRSGEVMAEQVYADLAQLPVFFSLDYDAKRTRDDTAYGLTAALGSSGAVLFETDTQYRVLAKDAAPGATNLVLVRRK